MTIEEIKELIKVANEGGIAELEVQRGDSRVRIRRAGLSHEVTLPTISPTPIVVAAPAPVAAPGTAIAGPTAAASTSHASEPTALLRILQIRGVRADGLGQTTDVAGRPRTRQIADRGHVL